MWMARGHGGGSSGYFVHAGCALTFAVILVNCYLVAMENYLGKLFNDMKVNVVSLWPKRIYAIQLQRMAARTHSLVTGDSTMFTALRNKLVLFRKFSNFLFPQVALWFT